MMPGYSSFTKRIALQQVIKQPDIPSFQLGVGVFETLESISHGRAVLTQPEQVPYVTAEISGLDDQSNFGVSGYGSLIPNVPIGDIPYYGEDTGGINL